MKQIERFDSNYQTVPIRIDPLTRRFPAPAFYYQFMAIVLRAWAKAKHRQYDGAAWSASSLDVLRALEKAGCCFEITGIEHIAKLAAPCVVVANHMSVLETTILPGLIQPHRKVTFVVKKSLIDYPIFKHIMRAREPIVVNRTNPRQDLETVLNEGLDRLNRGISVIVFPQTTRSDSFDPARFNSLGVKLALKAKAPVIPLALCTSAWANGQWIKEFGRIEPSLKIRFAFGPPLWIKGRGVQEHQKIIGFIGGKLDAWQNTD